tara:strand:- start:4233 stop:4838 length:606 start_codon:yes stop_codon:yes gene_type:complete
MRVHLIRHGQTNWNKEKRVQGHAESTLTLEGKQQAAALAPALKAYNIAKVYCSSSVRTRETAAILFAEPSLPIEYCDELREIFLGPWEGLLQSEIRELYPEDFAHFWNAPERFKQEGAELFDAVQQRGLMQLKRILSAHATEDVAIVSHGVLIKSILCALEGRPMAKLWEPPIMHNCAHSIVTCESPEATPRIIQFAGLAQ